MKRKLSLMQNERMADEISKCFSIDDNVYRAISNSSREEFVPSGFGHRAYSLDALPIASKQWISSPLTVAKMTQYLEHDGCDSVLEIGCGSGYQAAVLSQLFRRVFTVERISTLLNEARTKFSSQNLHNIHVRLDDGQFGWNEYAPYDRILFSASTPNIAHELFRQLKDGGILVAPIEKNGVQTITRFQRDGNNIIPKNLEVCEFVPILEGTE